MNDINKINYYIKIIEEQNLSVRKLRTKIKNNEYERLDDKTKEKLVSKEELLPQDFIKAPILIKNSYDYEVISEKILKELILEDLDNFLKELGSGFCYIENEYKIKIGQKYNYIDKNIRNINQDKTIGIIICKKDDKFIMEYVSDPRIFTSNFVLN